MKKEHLPWVVLNIPTVVLLLLSLYYCATAPAKPIDPDLLPTCVAGELYQTSNGDWYQCIWSGTYKPLVPCEDGKRPDGSDCRVYSWRLPGETMQQTCQLGEKFVNSAGEVFECANWPPSGKR